MKRHAPEVRHHMTHLPVEAERCETALDAWELMQQHQIHHLPVMSGSRLHGVVSKSGLLEAKLKLGQQFANCHVEAVCAIDPLVVGPVEPIDEVVRKMQGQQTDCAVIMDGGFVVGVFTTTDVLQFIAEFFGQES